jgi:hypothetical protein
MMMGENHILDLANFNIQLLQCLSIGRIILLVTSVDLQISMGTGE